MTGNFTLVVLSNLVTGRDAVFNAWRNGQHIKDVLAVPGFKKSAQRFAMRDDALGIETTWRYMATYLLETDQPQQAIAEMMSGAATKDMPLTDAMDPKVNVGPV